jgi:putative membrane-bound dehydrogenase-like protein
MKIPCLSFWTLLLMGGALSAADGIKTKTTHAAAYGPTKNAVTVDAAKDLPRYPAIPPKDAVGTWQVKKGFKLELAAHEPQVVDPIAICFDERGRMFVCEMIDYSEMRDVTPHLGRISMLEDKDGDGFYETGTIFADDLPWPTGLIWANGGLFVGATPDIWRFEDKDGDGKAEVREKVYTGFGTGLKILNVQGLMNSFQWGQDNRVHVLAGGGNRGKVKSLKRPELAEKELGGSDFWFDPLTYEFGLELGGAQYGMSFDNYGRKFGCSNSDHLQHWVYDGRDVGKNPHFNMTSSRQSIAVDGGAAEVFRLSPDEPWRIIRTRWRIAGVVKGVVEGGGRVSGYFTGATGTTIFRGDAYGESFVNNSFSGDGGGQLMHRKIISDAEDGVNLKGERPADEHGYEFAASKDTWVRMVNFANGPDGCLYGCDMYREVIEHPWSIPDEIKKYLDLNKGNDQGRIYRVVPDKWMGVKSEEQAAGKRRTKVALDKATTKELLKTLDHPNGWHRDTASRLLYERQDKALGSQVSFADYGPLAKFHLLGVLEGSGALNEDILIQALADKDAHVRERALQLVARSKAPPQVSGRLWQAVRPLFADPLPRVRFAAVLTAGHFALQQDQDLTASPLVAALVELLAKDRANSWIADAALALPPELAWPLFQQLSKQASGDKLLSGLAQTIGARNQAAEVTGLLNWMTEGGAKPATLRAFGDGLKRAGTSIQKIDGAGKLDGVFQRAAATAVNEKAAVATRLEAIDLLGVATSPASREALVKCLAAGGSETIQVVAIKTLALSSSPDVTSILITHWADYSPKAKEATLAALTGRDDRLPSLMEAMATDSVKGPTPKDLSAAQVQALLNHKNEKIATQAKKVLASVIPPSREEVVAKFKPAVDMKGDATRGQIQYLARCLACHRAGGQGIEVGPDLITVKTKGRDALLTAILEPSKEVASQFIAYTVTTKDGQTLSGVITKDDASSLSIKIMGGIEQTVQRSNILGTSSAGHSLMPEGLEAGMSVQDMADLVTFIEQLK